MTQREAIIKHLKSHKNGITSKDAFERYGCTRLSAVIKAIEQEKGLNIKHIDEKVKTRYGSTIVTRYILAK